MNLVTHTLPRFIAELIMDYLVATQDGTPDAEIPKELMDAIKEPVRPVLVITTKEEASKASARRVVKVNPVLCTWAKSEDPAAAENENQTTADEASVIMAGIDHRLRDAQAFATWLATLEPERRTGWTIMKIVHEGHAPPMRPDGSRSALYSLTMNLHLFVAPYTPD